MNLKDLKNKHIKYDWKTIFIGIQENYFNKDVIFDYAVELMDIGDESEFVSELAWGVSSEDLDKVMLEIKTNYFPQLDEESTMLVEENRKLRFVCLSEIKERCKEDNELLNEIAEFYGNHHYPEDMVSFVNYMPQEVPTTKEDLINRFEKFLKLERSRFKYE
ncbi:hypothetical protein CN327_03960 [Bacillus cereus]|uniref:DUF2247 family protein n=1 Tax=Bacillus nitratireducens TaxID=2026193 RepID=UPI000BEB5B17|nr:DUF2247 family protein [Bacillus nitratireducens]PEE17014.1 hypothetical protein CON53_16170 [Bacillus cereus]MED0905059.1 DUF2247 family protein [Bacillus nitratireducens]PES83810.1 hypothetical protein CN509_04590 [Bacillus cereus]PET03423.1 hypothetical protein CN505_19035 [Bacillus cereus]PFF36366.1 hypothetical protein CN327_03960 [Bacillus cereus]